MYPQELVVPMKAEMTNNGFKEMLNTQEVEQAFAQEGTSLVFINSVCGCAAGAARPGVIQSLQNTAKKPTNLYTTFAGFDVEAVKQTRNHLLPYPPSSPSIALIKDGQIVHMIERHMIEGRSAEMIAANLQQAYEAYC